MNYFTKTILLVALLAFSSPLFADKIHLQDGRVLEGKVVGEENGKVLIRLKWGVLRFNKSDIVKIVKKRTTKEEYQYQLNKLSYNDGDGYYKLGLFAKDHKWKKKALWCFQKAIKIDSNHKKARDELGYIYRGGRWVIKKAGAKNHSSTTEKGAKSENFTPPKSISKRALELIKKGDETFAQAKRALKDQRKKLKKTIFYFKAASNLAYYYAVPHYKLGILYQWTRKYLFAKKSLERAIALNPKFYEAYVELGDTYGWMSQYDKALKYYKKALSINPKYYLAYRAQGLIYCKMRQFKKSKENLQKAIALRTDLYSMRVLALVEKELKGLPWKTTYTIKSPHYVVYTNSSKEYGKTISDQAELIYRVYTKIFPRKKKPKKPKKPFPIYVFKTIKGYRSIGSPKGSAGYFHPLLQKLVFYYQPKLTNTLNVLYHEGFHQYVHYYAPYIPSWFNEGNGDFFGGCRKEGNKLMIKANKWRLGYIKKYIRNKKYVKISTLMQWSKAQMYSGRRGLHYAEAWSLVYFFWMYDRGKYRRQMKNYFSLIRQGYGRVEAYQKVFGKLDMDQVEMEWKDFVLKLK